MATVANGSERVEIALTGGLAPDVIEALKARFTLHTPYLEPEPLKAFAALGPRIRGAAGNGMSGLSALQINALPNLEIYSIMGVGLETTDLKACKARNITVTTAPVLYDDVADIAITLALGVCRRLAEADRAVRRGDWRTWRPVGMGRKFSGLRCGILGLGRIGIEVAKRLQGFTPHIAYYDPIPRNVPYRAAQSALELARDSDILFLCAAGQPKGVGKPLFDRAMIDALGPEGIFINIARGWLADEVELIAALKEGRLAGAGLDVFDNEPSVPEELMKLENTILTPHVASLTRQTMRDMGQCVVDNLTTWFAERRAVTPVPNA